MKLTHLSKASIPTPLGTMTAIAGEQGLCVLTFQEEQLFNHTYLIKNFPNPKYGMAFKKTMDHTKVWLKDYFAGKFNSLESPLFDLRGSQLANKAWEKLLKIPVGKTQSYGEIANQSGSPNGSRAIGRIMGQNPICIIIPCHRVIGSNGSLTGYGGGLDRKIWLLQHEGLLVR